VDEMQKLRTLGLVGVLVASIVLVAGCPGPSGGTNGAQYDTPEKCFDAAKKAAEARDFKTFLRFFTPEFKQTMGGMKVLLVQIETTVMPPQDEAGKQKLEEAKAMLKAHGVDVEKLDDLLTEAGFKDAMGDEKKAKAAMAKLGAKIKDLDGLLAKDLEKSNAPPDFLGTLGEVKIEGDSATGVVTIEEAEKMTIHFKKVSGGWLIDSLEV
jgi:hypothetical protein